MLNEEAITSLAKINIEVAKEALAQSEKKLADVLDTKKSIEQKALSLFSPFVTISMAVLGYGVSGVRDHTEDRHTILFAIPSAFFIIGAFLFLMALMGRQYGAIGSDPDHWLRDGVINGEDIELARMRAYLTTRMKNKIQKSIENNDKKYKLLHWGMAMGISGSIAFALILAGIYYC